MLALRGAVHVEGPILEPCAGRGHMVVELRGLGFEVEAADLYVYEDLLVPDIVTGVDVFDLDLLSGYRFVVTNLPYEDQVAILAHILPIAARDGCSVAVLARSEWRSAQGRRALVHDNPRFAGEVVLTKRPIWVRPVIKAPGIGSPGTSGRRCRARLTEIRSCASLGQWRGTDKTDRTDKTGEPTRPFTARSKAASPPATPKRAQDRR